MSLPDDISLFEAMERLNISTIAHMDRLDARIAELKSQAVDEPE